MNARIRLWKLIGGLSCVLIIVLGVLVGMLPQLETARTIAESSGEVSAQNDSQRAEIERLQQASAKQSELQREFEELTRAIPSDTNSEAGFVTHLQTAATAAEVSIQIITIEESGTAQSSAAPSPADPAAADPAAGDAAAGASTTGSTTQAQPSQTGIQAYTVTLELTGPPDQLAAFVRAVQTGDRLFLLTSINQDEAKATVVGTIYTYSEQKGS